MRKELQPLEYRELENCKLCAWECGVDRLAGEHGVCMMGTPEVASCQLHPAPPQSYTVFTAGCNFRCLNCQNWEIAHYPSNNMSVKGPIPPDIIAQSGVKEIRSWSGQLIGADRFFFSGGSPTVSLPWIEDVIVHAKAIDSDIKVNFDTNGFPSKQSFQRILSFSDSITFDIKAYNDEVHRSLTGAPVEPVLQNVEEMARHLDQLWEIRILIIPSIVDLPEIQAISEFLVSLDETLPICFLAFRPNYCLDLHPGPSEKLMREAVVVAQKNGLETVDWTGSTNIRGNMLSCPTHFQTRFTQESAALAAYYAQRAGCKQVHRSCETCDHKTSCRLKENIPSRST